MRELKSHFNPKKLVVKFLGAKQCKWMATAPTYIELKALLDQIEGIHVSSSRWPRKAHIVIRALPGGDVKEDAIIERISNKLSDHYPTITYTAAF